MPRVLRGRILLEEEEGDLRFERGSLGSLTILEGAGFLVVVEAFVAGLRLDGPAAAADLVAAFCSAVGHMMRGCLRAR